MSTDTMDDAESAPAARADTQAPQAPAAVPPPPAAVPATRAHRPIEWIVRLGVVALALAVVTVVIGGWDRWVGSRARQSTDDAYLHSDLTPLSARVPGYIRAVHVDDFAVVRAGQLVVEIVDDDYRTQVAQAEANVAGAQAAIETLQRQLAQQEDNIRAAAATSEGAAAITRRNELEAQRQRTLLAQRLAGTRQLVEQADAAFRQATAALQQAAAQLRAQQSQLAVIRGQIAQQQAALASARATLDLARINLGYTRIVAPTDGMVGRRQALAGQLVSAGTQRRVRRAPERFSAVPRQPNHGPCPGRRVIRLARQVPPHDRARLRRRCCRKGFVNDPTSPPLTCRPGALNHRRPERSRGG